MAGAEFSRAAGVDRAVGGFGRSPGADDDMSAVTLHIRCVDYTFNRDLDAVYAASGPAARRPERSIEDWLPRVCGVLDREALHRLCSLDPSGQSGIAVLVLRVFECSSQRWRRRLQVALGDDEAARLVDVVQTVQTLRSAAAVVGALTLARLCADAEGLAQGRRSRALDDAVDAIIAESGRILAVLATLRGR
jgi:hypothetical protein